MRTTLPVRSLPARNYTDSGVFEKEQKAIFSKTWQYACHVENLRNPGDYFVLEIAGESVFLACGKDRRIRGFFNVCVHRGARLLEGKGCNSRITCPYHGWTYSNSGSLLAAPNSHHVPGFDTSKFKLKEFLVTTVNGLVFVNLDENAESFSSFAPNLDQELNVCAPNLPDLTFVHRTQVNLSGNWKIAIENFAECYHCSLLHPDLVNGILDYENYRIEIQHNWHRHVSPGKAEQGEIYRYDSDGRMETDQFNGLWLWPNFAFQSYPGGAIHVWKWTPVDVMQTHVAVDWYFPSARLQDWEWQLINHHAENTFAEDIPIIESVQSGLCSHHYQPGPLMVDENMSQLSEHGVVDIQRLWSAVMA